MKLNAKERNLLSALSKAIQAVLQDGSEKPARRRIKRSRKPTEPAKKARVRRSAEDAAKLQKKVIAARNRNIPVAKIAAQNNVTTAYVYRLIGGK